MSRRRFFALRSPGEMHRKVLILLRKMKISPAPTPNNLAERDEYFGPACGRVYNLTSWPFAPHAAVAELADAHGSGPCSRKRVGVQLPPAAVGRKAWSRGHGAQSKIKGNRRRLV